MPASTSPRSRRVPRRPGRSPQRDPTTERALAFAGVAALLLALILSVVWIAGASGGDAEPEGGAPAAQEQARTPEPTPEPTEEPKPTPEPLTADERAERDAAAEIVASRGFEVTRLRDWDPEDTLRVLIGRTDSGGHLAFFFVNGDYIGNDSTDTSVKLKVRRTADLTATLRYGTYAPGDDPAKPTGDKVDVRFTWDGSTLAPETPPPDPSVRSPQ